mmetsp:Transcript_40780/g.41485  ORF Transcript_40780/g.41485 Transcript_40780/m.41485 type:complete len:82 (-) Transcript_40780:13-258(-)
MTGVRSFKDYLLETNGGDTLFLHQLLHSGGDNLQTVQVGGLFNFQTHDPAGWGSRGIRRSWQALLSSGLRLLNRVVMEEEF